MKPTQPISLIFTQEELQRAVDRATVDIRERTALAEQWLAEKTELFDVVQGLLDEIDRCGVKVSSELEAKARLITKGNSP